VYEKKYLVLPLVLFLLSSGMTSFSFASVESEAQEDIQAGCRDGQTLVYRDTYKDFVCVDPSTADRWVELGLAEIIRESSKSNSNEIPVDDIKLVETPKPVEVPPVPEKTHTVSSDDSECREGYALVYRFVHKDTFCTSPSTATSWERLGLAEIISSTLDVDSDDILLEENKILFETSDEEPRETSDEEPRETSDEEPRETSDEEPRETSDEEPRETDVSLSDSIMNNQFDFPQNIHQLNDRIWVGVGYDVTNTVLIEGEKGIIVIDSLSSYDSVKNLLDDFKSISDKPIKTIIFTKLSLESVNAVDAFIEYGDGSMEIIVHEDLLQFYNDIHDVDFQVTHTYSSEFSLDISGVEMNLYRIEGESSDQTYLVLPDDDGILIGDSVYGISPYILNLNYIQNISN